MAFQKQLIFFDGAIGRGSTDDANNDIMIAQIPGGASGLSIGHARPVRILGQVKTSNFDEPVGFTSMQFRAWLRNADGTVNELIKDDTVNQADLDVGDVFWNFPIPVVPELKTADRIRVQYNVTGSNPTSGEVFIGLIIGGQGVEPRVQPGNVPWDQTGLRATDQRQSA